MLWMADDLLSRIVGEIRERKEASRAAYEESQRLERALEALEAGAADAGARERAARRRARVPGGRWRAAPGANREAIVAVVRERPGVTAGEIVSVTGIARATVSSTVARLAGGGTLERVEMAGGGVGFRVPSSPRADTAAS
jgi:DNA-binding transcriptional ArsR family regulator